MGDQPTLVAPDEASDEPGPASVEKTRGERSVRSLWPVAVFAFGFAFIVFWYTPAFLYSQSGNEKQFVYPLIEAILVLAVPLVVSLFVLVAPAIFMRPAARRFYAGLLVALTGYVWVQGFLLVQKYGLLDGEIDLPYYAPAPLAIGFVLILGAAALLSRVRPAKMLVAWSLVLLVLVGHLGVMSVADPEPVRGFQRTPIGSLYDFGSENLMIILLDSFQSDFFADVLRERPDFAEALDGFTYYPNMLGAGPTTYATLPVIHAGHLRPAGQNMEDHFNGSVAQQSFENELTDADWKVTHLNPVGGICPARIDHCLQFDAITVSPQKRLVVQSAHLLDLSLFRLAPAELKRAVYNDGRWRAKAAFKSVSVEEASDSTLHDITTRARVVPGERVAKFLHLMGTHAPATRRGDCTLLETPVSPVTRNAALDQAECALTRIAALIRKLKRIGVYENMSIVLLADTGTAKVGSARVADKKWTKLIGSANPLLAVKPPGASGTLLTNEAQMSTVDVRPIICSLTKGCHSESTDSQSGVVRPRYFMDYEWHDQFWHALTLKNEKLYEVRGPMFDPASWKSLSRGSLPQVSKLTFGRSDRPDHFGFGWGPVQGRGTNEWRWGLGFEASLNLNLPDDLDSRLEFDIGTHPELTEQIMRVKVNLRPLRLVRVSGSQSRLVVHVPRGLARQKTDDILFSFTQHRPGEGPNRHVRRTKALAVRFDELRITYE